MAGKNKVTFEVRIEEELYWKLVAVAESDGLTLNNHLLHLIRTNVAYHERVHGKIDTAGARTRAEAQIRQGAKDSEAPSEGGAPLDGVSFD